MSWVNILKALPKPDAISGMLLTEAGLKLLISQAEGTDKKNIVGVRNKAQSLSEGKDMPEGLDGEAIQSNAEKLVTKLNEIIADSNSKAQTPLEDKLDTIIKNKDKKGLIELVGTGSKRDMNSKRRDRKTSLLKKNRSAILEFVDIEDTDIFFFETSKFSLVANKPASDENWDNKVASIRSQLSSTNIKIDLVKNMITLKFENKTDVPTMKLALTAAQMTDKPENKDDLIIFKKTGKYTRSPLLEIFDIGNSSLQVKNKVKSAEGKEYINTVSSAAHALGYLEIMTTPGIKKVLDFMPIPTLKSKKATRNVKLQLLGEKPRLSSSLRTLFSTSNFDLKSLMEQGTVETEIRYNSPKLREILEADDDREIGGVTSDDLTELRNLFTKTRNRIPVFLSRLRGKNMSTFKKINNELIQSRPNLFDTEEMEMLKKLAGMNPMAVKTKLTSHYGKDVDLRLARLLSKVLKDSTPFKEIEGGFKFVTPQGMDYNDMRDLVHGLKLIRQSDELSGENSKFNESLEDTLKNYSKGFVVAASGSPKPAEMIHFLYVLDFYYGRTSFKSVANKFKKGEGETKELVESAKENYSTIINSFVDSVKTKVDDILENKEQYQGSLTINNDTKAYLLFDKLEEKGLISSNRGN